MQIRPTKLMDLDRLTKIGYDDELAHLIEGATLITGDPCQTSSIPSNHPSHHILYIKMRHGQDYDTWLALARCWKLWDLDVRGYHQR